MKHRNYTVVVLYPARLQQRDQMMTYTAVVKAMTALDARPLGAYQAHQKQPPAERGRLEEWLPLVVFGGARIPLAYGWQA